MPEPTPDLHTLATERVMDAMGWADDRNHPGSEGVPPAACWTLAGEVADAVLAEAADELDARIHEAMRTGRENAGLDAYASAHQVAEWLRRLAATGPQAEAAPPSGADRFEELLTAEHEQFDRRGELLRSIVEYQDAPTLAATVPGTGSSGRVADETGPAVPQATPEPHEDAQAPDEEVYRDAARAGIIASAPSVALHAAAGHDGDAQACEPCNADAADIRKWPAAAPRCNS